MTSLVALAGALGACDRAPRAAARPAGVVDSVVPRTVALSRFRAGLDSVDALQGGAPSRDALVRAFVTALERSDTAAFQALLMSRAEFAWVYYPTNPQGLPPYDLSPELYWFLVDGRSRTGIARALEERGGRRLHVTGHTCDPTPSVEGRNRIYGPCVVRRVQAPGDTVAERLFGPIIERDGRFKFVSFANKL
jgi:hypothetical protein